jgi:apolipoprotein D and lipocalin family protein
MLAPVGLLLMFAANQPPLDVVPNIDLNRYQGKWYEIARLPNWFERSCDRDVTATYTLRPDGQIQVVNACLKSDGSPKQAKGRAKLRDPQGPNTKLKVTFFWPFYGDYWIIDLDPEYQWVLVAGGPSRKYLWLLSRTPMIDQVLYQRLMDEAKAKGFDTSHVIRTKQSGAD